MIEYSFTESRKIQEAYSKVCENDSSSAQSYNNEMADMYKEIKSGRFYSDEDIEAYVGKLNDILNRAKENGVSEDILAKPYQMCKTALYSRSQMHKDLDPTDTYKSDMNKLYKEISSGGKYSDDEVKNYTKKAFVISKLAENEGVSEDIIANSYHMCMAALYRRSQMHNID